MIDSMVRGARRLLLLAPMLLLVGTAHATTRSNPTTPRGVWIGTRTVDFQTLSSGLHGPWTKPALILIRNPVEWYAAMEKAGAMIALNPPDIDWSRNALVLAVLGEQPILGYNIEITQALRHAQDLLLKVNIELPDVPNPTQNFTSPFHLIQIRTWRSMGVKAEYNAVVPDLETDIVRPKRRDVVRSSESGEYGEYGSSVEPTTWGTLKGRFRP